MEDFFVTWCHACFETAGVWCDQWSEVLCSRSVWLRLFLRERRIEKLCDRFRCLVLLLWLNGHDDDDDVAEFRWRGTWYVTLIRCVSCLMLNYSRCSHVRCFWGQGGSQGALSKRCTPFDKRGAFNSWQVEKVLSWEVHICGLRARAGGPELLWPTWEAASCFENCPKQNLGWRA